MYLKLRGFGQQMLAVSKEVEGGHITTFAMLLFMATDKDTTFNFILTIQKNAHFSGFWFLVSGDADNKLNCRLVGWHGDIDPMLRSG